MNDNNNYEKLKQELSATLNINRLEKAIVSGKEVYLVDGEILATEEELRAKTRGEDWPHKTLKQSSFEPHHMVNAAKERLRNKNIEFASIEIVEMGSNPWNSVYKFECADGTGEKTTSLINFIKKPSNKREVTSREKVEETPYDFAISEPPMKMNIRAPHAVTFAEKHERADFELLEASPNNFLVRVNRYGGYLKRYRSFQQALSLDPNFNGVGSKAQFYTAMAIIEAGYEVELEYTIPATRKRLDIAIWDRGLNHLIGFIEIDGIQHFEKSEYFGDTSDDDVTARQSSDQEKEAFCHAIGAPIARIQDRRGTFSVNEVKKAAIGCLEEILRLRGLKDD